MRYKALLTLSIIAALFCSGLKAAETNGHYLQSTYDFLRHAEEI